MERHTIAAVLAAVALAGCGTSPSPSARPDGPVPWADLPPTHPHIPVEVIGRVTPAEVAAAPRCGAHDLRPGRTLPDGAMGTTYLDVSLRLVGPHPCRIDAGYPDVVLETPSGGSIPSQRSPVGFTGDHPRPVLVTRTAPAGLTVAWAVSHDCRDLDNTGVRWTLGAWTFRTRGFGRTSCSPGESSADPQVYPVAAGNHVRRVTPYDGLDVSGDLQLTASPGGTVGFTVTLTSRHDVRLDPCPDYRIGAYTGHGQGSDVVADHALNCADVPYRTTDGVPYLPARVPVSFAMRATAPRVDVPKLVWQLEVPSLYPALGGTITVR
jgi:hypothetical protein